MGLVRAASGYPNSLIDVSPAATNKTEAARPDSTFYLPIAHRPEDRKFNDGGDGADDGGGARGGGGGGSGELRERAERSDDGGGDDGGDGGAGDGGDIVLAPVDYLRRSAWVKAAQPGWLKCLSRIPGTRRAMRPKVCFATCFFPSSRVFNVRA